MLGKGVFRRAVLFLAALPIALAECGPETGGDSSSPGSFRVERPAFDGNAAYQLVRTQVAFGPRVPGDVGHSRQLEWMVGLLRESADSVELIPFQHVTSGGKTLDLTNVMARFRMESAHRLLLLTHWDTRPQSDQSPDPDLRRVPVPGANDGASGTAILLHLAALLSRSPAASGVDLLFVDGEDYGPHTPDMFLGSRHFARGLPGEGLWTYGFLLDMVGDADPRFPVEAYSAEYAPGVVQRIWGIAGELGFSTFFPTRVGPRVYDDHLPLNEAGLPTVDLIDFEYGPRNQLWHTPDDTPEQVSPETLRMVGEVVAELVYRGG